MAAVTNYHNLGDNTFVLTQFWREEVQNQLYWVEVRVSTGPRFLWKLWGKICPLPLPASGGFWQFLAFLGYGCITPVSAFLVTLPSSLHQISLGLPL